jgi:phosphatidylserine/phosphatidylglycerophosphate/cardiolipin synthase-like enzyme
LVVSADRTDGKTTSVQIEDWFLTPRQRGNRRTSLPPWCEGSLATPIVDGVDYFSRLVDEIEALGPGDHLFFTDWRGDPDQLMRDDGPTMVDLFRAAAKRGVVVRGLLWRSHLDIGQFSQEENRELSEKVEAAGGEVLLDQRVRRGGSHHQKLVVLRHRDNPERDIAFAGGIDLCHSRRDDSDHGGDRQAVPMSKRYGEHPPWHDVQVAIKGPAVGSLDTSFRERWNDPTSTATRRPIAWLHDVIRGANLDPGPLPPQPPDPPPCGPHAVQVLRTYPATKPNYPFAPDGERSIARGYSKAVIRARRLIYIEDQYMWSTDVARLFARALRNNPELHLVVVVPRYPDVDGALALPPNIVGRQQALALCKRAGGERVHVFDVENHAGTPVYVHAKVCVVDDVWASVGSDNFNRRSWTHDSELSCAVLDETRDEREPRDPAGTGDGARVYARDLRLRLMAEHLDTTDDTQLVDPLEAVEEIEAAADALDAWYEGGQAGERPPGRLRRHHPDRLHFFSRLWATPIYRFVYDPDGRPFRKRMRRAW